LSEEKTDYLKSIVHCLLITPNTPGYMNNVIEGALDYSVDSILDDYKKKWGLHYLFLVILINKIVRHNTLPKTLF